jgi:pyruvate,water dikinase
VSAYRADPAAREALDADQDPGVLLERLRREPTTTGQALDDYLDFVGFRLLDGFDISNHYALEMPDVLLRAIKTAIDGPGAVSGVDAEIAEIEAILRKRGIT